MITSNRQPMVPPGFRFHPTDEELLYYYLRKKLAYEAIDLDVIRDVDLNKLEPWDLTDRCRIESGPQNEWYFFCRKDKKYPTGTRTNRATAAGFWKATGRDKAIHLGNSKRIGMRKTLVFYTGRAPHGHRTDWIMHEYRLDRETSEVQEDAWVVCKVFQKKSHPRHILPETVVEEDQFNPSATSPRTMERKQTFHPPSDFYFNASMHLPQLLSSEPFVPPLVPPVTNGGVILPQESLNWDWSILDKLLASHQNLDQILQSKSFPPSQFR
ncbi:hypothetical protein OPV22_023406 [Ensete ventricosum]|uniref:NAC domain-containing protein n=1 Tax=Ensete ventricosum TaxID=4639 RepID=A0AAV8QWN5_ENSVE|nr:hypothetical protein OPV22_023406 [Ensete ventricosum]